MKNLKKVESRRGKLLLAILGLFVGLAVFIHYSHNYNIIREESGDIKVYENVESVLEIFKDMKEIIDDSAEWDNNNWIHQKYQKRLCNLDKTSIDKLRKFSFSQSYETKSNAKYTQ